MVSVSHSFSLPSWSQVPPLPVFWVKLAHYLMTSHIFYTAPQSIAPKTIEVALLYLSTSHIFILPLNQSLLKPSKLHPITHLYTPVSAWTTTGATTTNLNCDLWCCNTQITHWSGSTTPQSSNSIPSYLLIPSNILILPLNCPTPILLKSFNSILPSHLSNIFNYPSIVQLLNY